MLDNMLLKQLPGMCSANCYIRPRLLKKRITLIQRINRYPVDKIYPLPPFGLFKTWIALSSHYPVDKFIQVKVGYITFYPEDKIVVAQRWPPVVFALQ